MQCLHDFSWLKNTGERRNTHKHLHNIYISKVFKWTGVVKDNAEEHSNFRCRLFISLPLETLKGTRVHRFFSSNNRTCKTSINDIKALLQFIHRKSWRHSSSTSVHVHIICDLDDFVAWLLVPDWLIWVFKKLLISLDFHAQNSNKKPITFSELQLCC